VCERSGGHRAFGRRLDLHQGRWIRATKRAFVTFGNIFGLALADKQQRILLQASRCPRSRRGSKTMVVS
jgi:hypothetical protein